MFIVALLLDLYSVLTSSIQPSVLIAFNTKEIRELCTVEATAIKQLGSKIAGALKNRLADIEAAEFMNEVIAGAPRQAFIGDESCYLIDLGDGFTLILICNAVNPPMDTQGLVDWMQVRRVKVQAVKKL